MEIDIKEKILKLAPKKRTQREIASRLGMSSQSEMDSVYCALVELMHEGAIVEIDGRYSIPARVGAYFGELRGNKRGFAFLIREDGGEDIFVPHSRLNGAMHKDKVFVSIIKGDEGKVVSIVERGVTELVGTYVRERGYGFVIPDGNSYYSDLFVPPENARNIPNNTKVVARIVSYDGKNPTAKILEVIGKVGDKESEVLSILKAYGFFNTFSREAYEEIAHLSEDIDRTRTDYTRLLTVTIDGDDSKDLDDAISLVRNGDNYELYVHIADVSNYVRMNGAIDKEAIKRTTSVYFPSSVYPMLPKEISNGICSLNEGEDRMTLTVKCVVNKTGDVVDSLITKSFIRSDRRLTYGIVNKIVVDRDESLMKEYADVKDMLFDMYALSNILRRKRDERGYINFDTKESKIELDERGEVVSIEPYPYLESNGIIEEFMLLANETVAEFMYNLGYPFIYRVHDKPDSEKMREFQKFVEGLGHQLKGKEIHSGVLQRLLKEIEGEPIEPIVSKVMLRSMQKARYSTENTGHFGLASMYYCHFTSPIRRYPDLMIHRIIKYMLDGKMDNGRIRMLEKKCVEVAEKSSEMERNAEMAERDIDDYYKAKYMASRVGEKHTGVVSGVTSFAIFVELPSTVEGAVRIENLPDDRYTFDEKTFSVTGNNHRYALGDSVNIVVSGVDMENRRVNFLIDEDNI